MQNVCPPRDFFHKHPQNFDKEWSTWQKKLHLESLAMIWNLCSRWRWGVNFTSRPSFSHKIVQLPIELAAGWAPECLDVWNKRKISLPLPEFDRPSHSLVNKYTWSIKNIYSVINLVPQYKNARSSRGIEPRIITTTLGRPEWLASLPGWFIRGKIVYSTYWIDSRVVPSDDLRAVETR